MSVRATTDNDTMMGMGTPSRSFEVKGVSEMLRSVSEAFGTDLPDDAVTTGSTLYEGEVFVETDEDIVAACPEDLREFEAFLAQGAVKSGSGNEEDEDDDDFFQQAVAGGRTVSFEAGDDETEQASSSCPNAVAAPPTTTIQEEEEGAPIVKTDEIDAEGLEMFTEEFEMLQVMYDGCEEINDGKGIRVQILPQDTLDSAMCIRKKKSNGLFITFIRLRGYPHRAPEVTVEPWHNLLTRDEVDNIYRKLKEHAAACIGNPMLAAICATAAEIASEALSDPEWCGAVKEKVDEQTERMRETGLRTRLTTERLAPTLYLGSMGNIMGLVPRNFDLVLAENILKEELALNFEKMQRYLYMKYVDVHKHNRHLRQAAHILEKAEIVPVFHGTRMNSVGKIVRDGLVVPKESQVRCGSRYGRGIYATPDPELALCYAQRGYSGIGSVKLLLCALLKGRTKVIMDGEEPWGGGCTKNYDSHESEDGSQIVVFNEWQILPCYVLHLQERKEREIDCGNMDYLQNRARAEIAIAGGANRHKVLTAMARKNLPFGFGPKGDKFVVEDIAPYSDDEEEWGQFQELRGEGQPYEEYQHETMLNARPPGFDW